MPPLSASGGVPSPHQGKGLGLEYPEDGAGEGGAGGEALRKRLWLMVARHLIEVGLDSSVSIIGSLGATPAVCHHPSQTTNNPQHTTHTRQVKKIRVPEALSLLEECPLLHIEDLLPHLPDLVRARCCSVTTGG